MANTYVWAINTMATMPSPPAPIDQYVVSVTYTVSGTDGIYTSSIQGNAQFEIDMTATPASYSSLTESQVLGWIQAQPNVMTNMQANIDGQIASMVTSPVSPVVTRLPWVIS